MLELDWASLLFQIVNFVVLVALLNKFLFRSLNAKLKERGQTIADSLADAQEREAEAARLGDEWEAKRQQADQKAEEILQTAQMEANRHTLRLMTI